MSKELKTTSTKELKGNSISNLDLIDINIAALTESLSELSIPRLFYQLVFFVIDGSNSMNNHTKNKLTKAQEVHNGVNSIINRLKQSKNNQSFDISFISFSEDYEDVFSIKNVTDLADNQSFNPLDYVKPKGTMLNEALIHVQNITDSYYQDNKGKNCQVLIQILSDGAIHDYEKCLETINTIKQNERTTISCQFLESHIDEGDEWFSWDESLNQIDYDSPWTIEEVKNSEKRISNEFKKFATDSSFFKTSIDPEEVRKHMIKSISTVSKAIEQ